MEPSLDLSGSGAATAPLGWTGAAPELARILNVLDVRRGASQRSLDGLPFAGHDTTAGSENELQVVVEGAREDVDLAITLEASNYFKNILRRTAAGDSPRTVVTRLERYLSRARPDVWENSWVRFPRGALSVFADQVFAHDLRADKRDSDGPRRSDLGRFIFSHQGEEWLRVPVSYVLKLALADAVSAGAPPPPAVRAVGERLLGHYLNDNSSPETHSFYVVGLSPERGMGRAIARETSKRFLLTQLLVLYANERFGLKRSGQRAVVYFAPHPPIRQKELNGLISDAFYRELFINPCLSGWTRGEDKYRYMVLCHQVLSRSHLNAIIKLKDAGIITRNLVVLPSASNISLANNGTHLSLGSRKLTQLIRDPASGFGPAGEKYLGDLVIKIVEHFLPLFVGTYSAAPYRLDFWDFHPEKALGFLAHELDFTHLRMLWRRWKKKAGLKVFGQPVTPLGPPWLDKALSVVLGLRGDFIPDFRLIDYLVALMSTDQSPALSGHLGSDGKLKRDLAELGVFDEAMSVYLPYKHRAYGAVGFSGFEGRQYSVFDSLLEDLGEAASLQTLLTALAYQYILRGDVIHADIPDDPGIESERRQIFFGSAIGLPTFFVRHDTGNRFLRRILARTKRTRLSRRYPGYLRVYHLDYRQALLAILREDATELIEVFGLGDTLERLAERLNRPQHCSALGKLTRGILDEAGVASPMRLSGGDFNRATETYYRTTLRRRHLREALGLLQEDCRHLPPDDRHLAGATLGETSADGFPARREAEVLDETADLQTLTQLIRLTLVTIRRDMADADAGSGTA